MRPALYTSCRDKLLRHDWVLAPTMMANPAHMQRIARYPRSSRVRARGEHVGFVFESSSATVSLTRSIARVLLSLRAGYAATVPTRLLTSAKFESDPFLRRRCGSTRRVVTSSTLPTPVAQ